MGTVVYGHWGPPLLAFPTSGGNERELESQGLIDALADFLDAGRVKIFATDAANAEGLLNRSAHPLHRSYVQNQYALFVRHEVVPFIRAHCRTPDIGVATMGASLGAYHAANTLFRDPDVFRRCFALSGVYDIRRFMSGAYDDNVYFNNPVDYLANLSDSHILGQLARCDIHIVTGRGPWEDRGPSGHLAGILASRGIPHHLDDWGLDGGHDWPYWKRQMRVYLEKYY
jgi:esterase/lipase superfamily enzyme